MQTYMLTIGTKVYYTGDMANHDGHFVIVAYRNGAQYDLKEIDGDRDFRGVRFVATEYKGNCGDRFVTREAWEANRAARIEESKRAFYRANYLAHERATQS